MLGVALGSLCVELSQKKVALAMEGVPEMVWCVGVRVLLLS